MQKLELTLPSPEENLALDTALLAACEAGEIRTGVLRLWEPADYCVVLGRSSRPEIEVNLAACRAGKIPVLRRSSGGGTIVAGPGCLMYSVVFGFEEHPDLHGIDRIHKYVLEKLLACLAGQVSGIARGGISDLVICKNGIAEKFSGNALRVKRSHFLYHGALLYDFDLPRIAELLATPTRQPEYRQGRNHREFVTNLPLNREQISQALSTGWQAHEPLLEWPRERVRQIVREHR